MKMLLMRMLVRKTDDQKLPTCWIQFQDHGDYWTGFLLHDDDDDNNDNVSNNNDDENNNEKGADDYQTRYSSLWGAESSDVGDFENFNKTMMMITKWWLRNDDDDYY